MALPKTPLFYKLMAEAIQAFGERNNLTARQHFAPLLGFKGVNSAISLSTSLNYTTYNPVTPKPISVDQLYILLTELHEDRNIIIDGLLKEFDLIAVSKNRSSPSCEEISSLSDTANFENNDVFKSVKTALRDGHITSSERLEILKEMDESDKASAELRSKVEALVVHSTLN